MKNSTVKLLALLLCLVLSVVVMIACSGGDNHTETTADTTNPPAETTVDTTKDAQTQDTTPEVATQDSEVVTTPESADTFIAETTAQTPAETEAQTEAETKTPRPEFDPQAAADKGMNVNSDAYTMSYESENVAGQWEILSVYPDKYVDKPFTLTGFAHTTDDGATVVILDATKSDVLVYVYYPAGVTTPMEGDLVKVQATYTQTIDRGTESDYVCYTMMATDVDVLDRGKGPNGGIYMYVTASSLNVRSEPYSKDTAGNALNNVVGGLSQGDLVEVIEDGFGYNGNWVKIIFADGPDGIAYVSGDYLSETKP